MRSAIIKKKPGKKYGLFCITMVRSKIITRISKTEIYGTIMQLVAVLDKPTNVLYEYLREKI